MRRIFSRNFPVQISLTMLAMLSLASFAAYAQSLGDVARENRDKKTADASSTPPKVITNANLPKDPDADAAQNDSEDESQTSSSQARQESSRQAAAQRAAEQRVAAQWKRKILAQENTIANLRLRIDRLKASIHFVDENTTYDYYAGVAHNQYEARQLERLQRLQEQLAAQRHKLEDLQEAARHAGMHTTVYDP